MSNFSIFQFWSRGGKVEKVKKVAKVEMGMESRDGK